MQSSLRPPCMFRRCGGRCATFTAPKPVVRGRAGAQSTRYNVLAYVEPIAQVVVRPVAVAPVRPLSLPNPGMELPPVSLPSLPDSGLAPLPAMRSAAPQPPPQQPIGARCETHNIQTKTCGSFDHQADIQAGGNAVEGELSSRAGPKFCRTQCMQLTCRTQCIHEAIGRMRYPPILHVWRSTMSV